MPLVNGTGNSPSLGRPTPGVPGGRILLHSSKSIWTFNFKDAMCQNVCTRHGLQEGFSARCMQCEGDACMNAIFKLCLLV